MDFQINWQQKTRLLLIGSFEQTKKLWLNLVGRPDKGIPFYLVAKAIV